MSEMEKLAATMLQKKNEETAKAEALKSSREAKIKQWVESLDKLFANIEKWFEPLIENELVGIERFDKKITESANSEYRVSYEAPAFALVVNGKAARIEPKALYLNGSDGVVEIKANDKQYLLIRNVADETEWRLVDAANKTSKGVPFTQDSLARAFMHYL
ncbi:hypothetical protein K3169_11060 [Pseudomonas phytophila]|uniref:Uncharacterized protein n=1 Tax=Pseudomonas phytophila TaxID=2867264 RepID=A0ABY6FKJ8_9PSED|nr:hypothetical protein [Pseudomonas phytophila]UXZ98354.1 hypothetical protein K3169_11060 [Pseudomonas phytophila]